MKYTASTLDRMSRKDILRVVSPEKMQVDPINHDVKAVIMIGVPAIRTRTQRFLPVLFTRSGDLYRTIHTESLRINTPCTVSHLYASLLPMFYFCDTVQLNLTWSSLQVNAADTSANTGSTNPPPTSGWTPPTSASISTWYDTLFPRVTIHPSRYTAQAIDILEEPAGGTDPTPPPNQ